MQPWGMKTPPSAFKIKRKSEIGAGDGGGILDNQLLHKVQPSLGAPSATANVCSCLIDGLTRSLTVAHLWFRICRSSAHDTKGVCAQRKSLETHADMPLAGKPRGATHMQSGVGKPHGSTSHCAILYGDDLPPPSSGQHCRLETMMP